MPVLTLPDLDDVTYDRLQQRARDNARSPEAEARAVLDQALRNQRAELVRRMEAFRSRLAERGYKGDPLAELRSDRDRSSSTC